jgi:menaquinone-dependent protoporphyrinogen IX oxidase
LSHQLEPTEPARRPRILFVYYTYTQQTRRVVEAMTDVLRDRGCEVQNAAIKFTDPRYADRFTEFPMPHPFREVVAMILPELRRATGEIRVPDEASGRDYDLVCIGSPTWWLSTSVPVRSFLESDAAGQLLNGRRFAAFAACRRYWRHNLKTVKKLGTKRGGVFVDAIHFRYQGGQVRSLLSLLSYLGTGEYRDRYLGVKIPPTNIQEYHLEAARTFANELADRLSDVESTVTTGAPP